MITLKEISFKYPKKSELFTDLNLTLSSGKIYGLFGVNGAGKTTLLKLMGGLLTSGKGNINIGSLNVKSKNTTLLSQMFLVPEQFDLPPIRSERFVKLNAPFYSNFDIELYKKCMSEFQMEGDEKLHQMSYGQKKKFLISFAIGTQTPILLMDEPTNGLDIPSKSQFRKIMAQVAHGNRCIIISTHQVRDLATMIDHAVIVDKGQIVFNQSLDSISQKLFFGHVPENQSQNAIYSEETLTGHNVILKGENKESNVDLEILFNAVIEDSEKINQAL